MVFKIGDRVFAKTNLMKCSILGTIIQEHDERVNVRFDFPIRGRISDWVLRSNCMATKEKKIQSKKNKSLKKRADNILKNIGAQ